MVAASKGYDLVLVMPASMSLERRVMLKALGAKLVLTPGEKGMKGAIEKAMFILNKSTAEASAEGGDPHKKYFMLQQFNNSDNPKAHRETTGPEIWYQTEGKVDIFISGVGTGGTLTGSTQFLRTQNPNMKVVAVEPSESAVLSGKPAGPHKIQGIGAGFIPKNCDTTLIDEIFLVNSERSVEVAKAVAKSDGIFVGISSGAAIAAALEVGSRPENTGKTIVAIIPSFGERYLSTVLFADLHAEAAAQLAEPIDA